MRDNSMEEENLKLMDRQVALTRAAVSVVSWTILFFSTIFVPMMAVIVHQTPSIHSNRMAAGNIEITPTSVDLTVIALQKENLIQNVDQQQHNLGNWLWNNAPTLGVIVIAIVGIVRWFGDRRDQRTVRTEERFQSIIEGLGGERLETRTAAAVMLRTFLRPGYEDFYSQVFDLVVANLRSQKYLGSSTSESSNPLIQVFTSASLPFQRHSQPNASQDSLSQVLITTFRESFPRARDRLKQQTHRFDPKSLNAADIQLDKAYLYGADLQEAWMPGASLREADLKGAKLNPIKLEKANLSGAELNAATLTGANLIGATLTRAILTRATLPKASLEGATLTNITLIGADLTDAILIKADLTKANLTEAILIGVDLTDATLTNANLTQADLSGSNPEAATYLTGAIMHNVIGLSEEQRKACKSKGAIID